MSISSKLQAPKGAVYLEDWMTEIPTNCVLNKGITGCGATTLAIQQSGHTLIAVPFVGLIQNKVHQHGDILMGIYGEGDKTNEIADYIASHPTIKIMTTYDSLPKVCRILSKLGINPCEETHVVIDEWHTLFQSYLFKTDVARNLLAEASKMKKVTYISATPIEREYWLEEIKHLPEIEIEWPYADVRHLDSIKVDKPLNHMSSLCRARINNGGEANYHIFLNSVKGISRIIRLANLTPDDVRVVCSVSDGKRNESILPAGFTIAATTDPVKPINFYTSTCFEGQDIYDKNGRTFIVSDGFTNHTKIDISTSFIQICGRIRDSQYKGQVTQVYATSRYKGVSLEEFAASIDKDITDAEHDVALLDQFSERRRKNWLSKIEKGVDRFIFVDGDQARVDHNMAKLEIVNYKIVNGIYRSFYNMTQELKRVGFEIDSCRELEAETIVTQSPSASKSTFKDAFEEYCQIMESKPQFCFTANPRQERIEFDKPLVKEAYQKLGAEEVRKLNYRQKDIKRALIVKSKEAQDVKIVRMVNASIPKQTPVPAKKVKELLQKIYEELGICSTAKATDLKNWYDIKKSSVRIDGITTACVTIIRQLINLGI